MTNQVFLEALKEVWYMGLIVFAFSSLWGNKMGEKLRINTAQKTTIHIFIE